MTVPSLSACYSDTEVPARPAAAERKLLTEQAERSGKPANIIERMVAGRLHKVQAS